MDIELSHGHLLGALESLGLHWAFGQDEGAAIHAKGSGSKDEDDSLDGDDEDDEDEDEAFHARRVTPVPVLQPPPVGAPVGVSSVSAPASAARIMTLARAADLTNLLHFELEDVLPVFQAAEDVEGQLSKAVFLRVMRSFGSTQRDAEDVQLAAEAAERLFLAFDVNGDGVVDTLEVQAGLAAVCGGAGDARVRLAFETIDADGSGGLSFDELARFLSSYLSAV